MFFYGFFNSFTGQYLYEAWTNQLFNPIFTLLPIIVYCLLDKEHQSKALINQNELYKNGP